MNRQFLTTLMLFLIIITGYNQFVVLPRERAAKLAAEEQLKAKEAREENEKAALLSGTRLYKEKPAPKPEELTTLSLPQADVTFSSKGAGIKTYLFKDGKTDVDLTPYPGPGYFTTMPDVDFAETSRTQNSITFEGEIIPGLRVIKEYTFEDNGINHLSLSVQNNTAEEIPVAPWSWNFGPGLATVKSEMSDNERESKAVYLVQEAGKKKPTLETFTKTSKQPSLPWTWAGVENRYFLAVLIPQGWQPGLLSADKVNIGTQKRMWGLFGESELTGPQLTVGVAGARLNPGEKQVYESDFYFGPKDYTAFLNLPYNLDRSIAFGFFGALGKIARKVLEVFYGWTGNYGVAIILITICLQVLLFRLTLMQYKSQAQMQKLQPEIQRIQDKYKDNPQAMNQAVMEFYQKRGINPLAGCLPMFIPLMIQMPIFIALLNTLRTSWSLHGAKFAGWITDLSAKDPYYILPLLMGGAMYLQQRKSMSGAAANSPQMAMFKYMPLFFTLICLNFPSGLVLYWFTNSLLMFGVQLLVNRKLEKEKVQPKVKKVNAK